MLVHATDSNGVTRSLTLQHARLFHVFEHLQTEEITLPDKLDARLVSLLDTTDLLLTSESAAQLLQLVSIADFLQCYTAVDKVLESIALRLQLGLDTLESFQVLPFYKWRWAP